MLFVVSRFARSSEAKQEQVFTCHVSHKRKRIWAKGLKGSLVDPILATAYEI